MTAHAYHNTLAAGGVKLRSYVAQAETQDAKVLEFMRHNARVEFSCEDISRHVLPRAPITSARRSLSNLYRDGFIVTTGKISGHYNRPVYLWRIADQSGQTELFE